MLMVHTSVTPTTDLRTQQTSVTQLSATVSPRTHKVPQLRPGFSQPSAPSDASVTELLPPFRRRCTGGAELMSSDKLLTQLTPLLASARLPRRGPPRKLIRNREPRSKVADSCVIRLIGCVFCRARRKTLRRQIQPRLCLSL